METWAWLLAYIVGFGLLQLLLYHHFRRNDATPESAGGAGEHGGNGVVGGSDENGPEDPGVYCQHCGTRNEHAATVKYCHHCVSPLR